MKKILILLSFVIFGLTSVNAQLLTEDFNYGAVGDTSILNVTTNWVRHSGTMGPVYLPIGLQYAGYMGSGIGGALSFKYGGSAVNDGDIHRKLADSVTVTGDVYATFMFRIDTARATSDYFFHLGPYTIGTTFRGRVYVRSNGTGFSMSLSKTGTPIVDDATILNLGQTYVAVVKYSLNTTATNDDLVTLYVYSDGVPPVEPGTPAVTIGPVGATVTDGLNNIGSVAVRQGTNSPVAVIDGIRVTTSWQQFVPVELTSFAASVSGSVVKLDWTTATEENNRGFEIERKSGSSDFAAIAFVSGAGTTTETRNYSYTDETASAGVYTYRLKQVDFDGTVSLSKEVEVDLTIPAQFELGQNYPNPFNPSTVISYNMPVNGLVTLKVYDLLGNEAATLVNEVKEAGRHNISFNASGLSSGVYYYTLTAPGYTATKKLTLVK